MQEATRVAKNSVGLSFEWNFCWQQYVIVVISCIVNRFYATPEEIARFYFSDNCLLHLREQSFLPGGGLSVCGGTDFFGVSQRGRTSFLFSGPKGDQNFFAHAKGGGPERIVDRWSQTDAPLPVKNGSSLTRNDAYMMWLLSYSTSVTISNM